MGDTVNTHLVYLLTVRYIKVILRFCESLLESVEKIKVLNHKLKLYYALNEETIQESNELKSLWLGTVNHVARLVIRIVLC